MTHTGDVVSYIAGGIDRGIGPNGEPCLLLYDADGCVVRALRCRVTNIASWLAQGVTKTDRKRFAQVLVAQDGPAPPSPKPPPNPKGMRMNAQEKDLYGPDSVFTAEEQAAMQRGYTTAERLAESGRVFGVYPQAISQAHADKLDRHWERMGYLRPSEMNGK